MKYLSKASCHLFLRAKCLAFVRGKRNTVERGKARRACIGKPSGFKQTPCLVHYSVGQDLGGALPGGRLCSTGRQLGLGDILPGWLLPPRPPPLSTCHLVFQGLLPWLGFLTAGWSQDNDTSVWQLASRRQETEAARKLRPQRSTPSPYSVAENSHEARSDAGDWENRPHPVLG